jgi:hypothetical protein
MPFILRKVSTGDAKTFTAREILGLIGDKINDEIIIQGEVFRISTCQEISGGGIFIMDWISRTLDIRFDGDTVFYMPDTVEDKESVFLTVNNILYTHGVQADYHIEADRIYWHGNFALETSDKLVVRYPIIIT